MAPIIALTWAVWHRKGLVRRTDCLSSITAIAALAILAPSCGGDAGGSGPSPPEAVVCCELGAPSCNCTVVGTGPGGVCVKVCDAAGPWRLEKDERGCPRYVTGSGSCLRPPPSRDSGLSSPAPVGASCTDDDTCNPADDVVGACSAALGDPSPVCVGIDCDPRAPGARCADGKGTCARHSTGFLCWPRCTFGDDGTAPVGCGRNACHALGLLAASDAGLDTGGGTEGFGYCAGGCVADADCPAATPYCQLETARCMPVRLTPTKALGELCTESDGIEPPWNCACRHAPSGYGYCTRACRVVTDEACPTGWACDADLPPTFGKAPNGMGGMCAKICETDADCAGLASRCVVTGALSVRVCRPG